MTTNLQNGNVSIAVRFVYVLEILDSENFFIRLIHVARSS